MRQSQKADGASGRFGGAVARGNPADACTGCVERSAGGPACIGYVCSPRRRRGDTVEKLRPSIGRGLGRSEGRSGSDLKTVPVAINGKPKQFLLDIGTNPTEVSRATVADLALPDADRSLDTLYANDNRPSDAAAFTNASYFPSVAFLNVKSSAAGLPLACPHRLLHDRRRHRP